MTANIKWKRLARSELDRSFWEGFRSAFDFFSPADRTADHITLTPSPKMIHIQVSGGPASDLANLNSDISNLSIDANAATMKVLNRKRP